MVKLSKLEGISAKFRQLLLQAGVEDQQQLLIYGKDKAARQSLAKKTGINPKLILKWVQHADLARINGVGEEYAELLQQSGVNSVTALAQYTPDKLFQLLTDFNEQTKLVKIMPPPTKIQTWIEQAQLLPTEVS